MRDKWMDSEDFDAIRDDEGFVAVFDEIKEYC